MACLAAALLLAAPVFGQTDTLKKRQVNLDLNFLAHGEICGGGLPAQLSLPSSGRPFFWAVPA